MSGGRELAVLCFANETFTVVVAARDVDVMSWN